MTALTLFGRVRQWLGGGGHAAAGALSPSSAAGDGVDDDESDVLDRSGEPEAENMYVSGYMDADEHHDDPVAPPGGSHDEHAAGKEASMARAEGDAQDGGEHMFFDAAEPMLVAEDAEEDADDISVVFLDAPGMPNSGTMAADDRYDGASDVQGCFGNLDDDALHIIFSHMLLDAKALATLTCVDHRCCRVARVVGEASEQQRFEALKAEWTPWLMHIVERSGAENAFVCGRAAHIASQLELAKDAARKNATLADGSVHAALERCLFAQRKRDIVVTEAESWVSYPTDALKPSVLECEQLITFIENFFRDPSLTFGTSFAINGCEYTTLPLQRMAYATRVVAARGLLAAMLLPRVEALLIVTGTHIGPHTCSGFLAVLDDLSG